MLYEVVRDQARADDLVDARGGAVVIVQRFGGSVNLTVHSHILALDGVFVPEGDDLRFRPLDSLDAVDVADVLATIVPGVRRRSCASSRHCQVADERAFFSLGAERPSLGQQAHVTSSH